ncbi:MAG: type II toxin-antitoxin system YafQ family toxin [Prolixibacteraceae bacterium]|nr:type II toxin-antitoxin system YafQ family toxin [Prolixibacteraceae bacterium]
MYRLVVTHRFKKDVKLLQKRGYDMNIFKMIILQLEKEGKLPADSSTHKLLGKYSGYYEAHIKPDWLIIWKMLPFDNEIWLVRTGTHADLF